MKLRILNNTDSSLEAWKISRPLDMGTLPSEVHNLDLPVSEFCRFDLEIESSIFVRELFCTLRDHVVWAQTSRVQDVTAFEMEPLLGANGLYESIRQGMIEMKEQGHSQDSYRLLLPLFSLTTYTISISLRHLKNVALNLAHIAGKCKSDNVKAILWDGSNEIMNLIEGYYTVSHKMKPILNEKPIGSQSGKTGQFTVLTGDLPLHLRAQIVRHRQLLVADNLIDLVTLPLAERLQIKDEARVQVVGTADFLESIYSKRSCWIAHYAVWAGFLSGISKQKEPSLPCADGVCPFRKDVMLRVEKLDPNPPCPIFLELESIPVDSNTIHEIKQQRILDKRPDYWDKYINILEKKL